MIIKEACIETQDEFDRAFLHHADQYEICSQLELGGLTPSLELVKYASTKTKHSLVMIRRKNDFSSDSSHTQELLKDIKSFINLNIQGFVFGFLNNKNEVDINTTQTLVEACGNKEIVFHMAFDKIINWKKAIDELVELKVTRILTKGGENGPAVNNINHLNKLKAYANNRIQLIVGGSVDDDNCPSIYHQTQIKRYHGRKLAVK